MLDEAVFKGMSTPSHYNAVSIEKIKPSTQIFKIPKPSEKPPAVKTNNLSPNSYRFDEAWNKTQTTKHGISIAKGKNIPFIEM